MLTGAAGGANQIDLFASLSRATGTNAPVAGFAALAFSAAAILHAAFESGPPVGFDPRPAIVQQQYNDAKAALDHGEFAAAAKGFQQVVAALNDSDLAPMAANPPLSDLRTLAAGFRELSAKAIPPPPPPVAVAPSAPVRLQPAIYSSDERGVTPPVIVRQELPRYMGTVGANGIKGVVEVIINEAGGVESAMMLTPTGTSYDATAVMAATKWRYEPATADGAPVKYRKRIQIKIAAP